MPHTTGPIQIDGEWAEPDWSKTAKRGQFKGDDGQLARPSSEVRFLRDDHDLIVALYAADENIQHTDAFDLTIAPPSASLRAGSGSQVASGSLALHVDATGHFTPAVPGVRAASGFDEGTLDDPRDDDEEWVVEVAIPLTALPKASGGHLDARASRCDIPKDGIERCGSWSGTLSLE